MSERNFDRLLKVVESIITNSQPYKALPSEIKYIVFKPDARRGKTCITAHASFLTVIVHSHAMGFVQRPRVMFGVIFNSSKGMERVGLLTFDHILLIKFLITGQFNFVYFFLSHSIWETSIGCDFWIKDGRTLFFLWGIFYKQTN